MHLISFRGTGCFRLMVLLKRGSIDFWSANKKSAVYADLEHRRHHGAGASIDYIAPQVPPSLYDVI